jgi:hypothetical protein
MKKFAAFLATEQLAIDISPSNAWGEWWDWRSDEIEKEHNEAARKGSLSRKIQQGSQPDVITL